MKRFIFAFPILIVAALCGCKAKQETSVVPSESAASVEISKDIEIPVRKKAEKKEPSEFHLLSLEKSDDENGNEAHKKYLDDAMKFSPLPEQEFEEGAKTYVVGNSECIMYEEISLSSDDDLGKLIKICDIPKGAILVADGNPIKATGKEDYWDGLFSFKEELNFFFPVKYDGKKGIVFGAYLLPGIGTSPEKNTIYSLLYGNADEENLAHFENFYPICGHSRLGDDVTESLEINRIAFQDVLKKEYYLSVGNPDDMVSLYQTHGGVHMSPELGKNLTPIFITTDLLAHSQHLMFDRLLMKIEEDILYDRIIDITSLFISKISSDLVNYPENETLQKAKMYFEVGKALAMNAPSYYGDDVKSDAESALYQSGETSKVFTFSDGSVYRDNFSIYIPRGHYTNSEKLKNYFRSMTWFSSINFSLTGNSFGDDSILKNMAPIALYITDLVSKDEEIFSLWKSIFDPITALIGKSDDLSFFDLLPLWNSLNVENAIEWISDENNIKTFSNLAKEKLEGPAIADKKQDEVVMGWRFLGQRFTYDAYIFNQLSSPRLSGRAMISGLDIAATFGSRTADGLLESEYEKYPEMKPQIEKFKLFFDEKDEPFWSETYYNTVLALSRSQSRFEQGAGFYFTETPLWNIKSLEASLSTWAELKHDTLLYAKQSFAEKGGGEIMPTYRIDKLPSPVHYIEPNLDFFVYLYNSLGTLSKIIYDYKLFPEISRTNDDVKTVINSMMEIARKSMEIVKKEILDLPVYENDLEWIGNLPALLSKVVFPFDTQDGSGTTNNTDQFKMAIIADVFTNAVNGEILEVGVGIPKRIYVALNDAQGGKRIAVGYKHSYYEFTSKIRMTDEDWKNKVYSSIDALEEYKPEWCKGLSLNATGFGK